MKHGNESHVLHDTVSFIDKAQEIPSNLRRKYIEFVLELANDRAATNFYASAKQWHNLLLKLRKKYKIHPRKAQINAIYLECLSNGEIKSPHFNLEQYLVNKPTRSLSGVLVIAVVMSPFPQYFDLKSGKVKQQRFSCAHNCYYCPNEPGMPRSYLSKESAVSRAKRAEFDAINQFYARSDTLQKIGHDIDKIELLVLGGTFSEYPHEYQTQFIRDLFWSANTFYDGINDYKLKRARKSLAEEIKIHETAAKCRIVGLTLETRPDSITDYKTIKRFRDLGCTRLQIGIQHTDNNILKYVNRGCTNEDAIKAVRLLKNCGYKIDIHIMPNLPGSSAQKDRQMFDELLNSDLLQCDQWKIYPCQTVDYSLIKKWYEQGVYKPYDMKQLMEVITSVRSKIHPWIRLNRIYRSFPAEYIASGITITNFRQYMNEKLEAKGLKCACIRCREFGSQIKKGKDISGMKIRLRKREYKSSGGHEIFISFESEDESVLIGFVRLRLPPNDDNDEYKQLKDTFPELHQAALIRELHVYGSKQNVKRLSDTKAGFGDESHLGSKLSANAKESNLLRDKENITQQSKGYGIKLMTIAEVIAKEHGYKRIAVIAGVGTRLYYRLKLEYKLEGSYMVKDFDERSVGISATKEALRGLTLGAILMCFILYIISTFMSINTSLMFSMIYMLYLDYLHFYHIKYDASLNIHLLWMSRIALLWLNLSILFRVFSGFMSRIFGECYCQTYWSLSLLCYISAIYMLKFMYHKRVLIMLQDPMFGNDSGMQSMPRINTILFTSKIIVFSICAYMMIHYVYGECIEDSDQCSDSFDPIDLWFAIIAITFDATLFTFFLRKWYGMMMIFMEDMALSLLVQFSLIIIVLVSCIMDAIVHMIALYASGGVRHFNSYLIAPSYCLDCLILATCIVISFTDSQKYLLNKIGAQYLKPYYKSLEKLGYSLHIM